MCTLEGNADQIRTPAVENIEAASAATPFQADERSTNWRLLMIRAQRGDARAYDILLRDLFRWLRAYFQRRLPPNAVDDAVQETLTAVHGMHLSYQPDRPFGPWLAAIARYKWIDAIRQQRRHATKPLEDEAETLGVDDHGASTCSALILAETIARLKPAQATAIQLVKIQGNSIEEASLATGQSPSLVKVNIHRGLRKIAAMIDCPAGSG